MQISNWFVNARRRILQPMMDAIRVQGKSVEELREMFLRDTSAD